MEGGGISTSGIQLSNIGDYEDVDDLYTIGSASLFSVFLSIVGARIGNVGGISINTYFDSFGLEGVLSNVMLIVIILQIARWIYSTFYNKFGKPWSPLVFISIVLSLQLIHDVLFYYGVINLLPGGKNEMIDVLKQYAKENKGAAIGGHSIFIIMVSFVAMILKDTSTIIRLLIPAIILYMLPYVLSIVSKTSNTVNSVASTAASTVTTAAAKVTAVSSAKKESFYDARRSFY
jgi:hypothetical protein